MVTSWPSYFPACSIVIVVIGRFFELAAKPAVYQIRATLLRLQRLTRKTRVPAARRPNVG
jgi:hypothetical protein